MATSWTDVTLTSTAEYQQLEPNPGFGKNSFGDRTDDIRISMHSRGFGDPTTQFTAITKPTTIWS